MKTSILYLSLVVILFACKDNSESKCQLEEPQRSFTINGDSIVVVLNKVNGAVGYFVYLANVNGTNPNWYSAVGDPLNDTIFYIETSVVYPGTQYKVLAKAYNTNFSSCINLKAENEIITTPCAPFKYFTFPVIKSTSATVSWYKGNGWEKESDHDVSPFTLFTVNLRVKGSTDITFNSTDQHYITLTDLKSNTEYEAQLVYTCIDNNIYTSEWKSFTTL